MSNDAVVSGVSASEVRAQMEADVERTCLSHVAVLSDGDRLLTFHRPGTGICGLRFRIERNYLLVFGDMGDAVYAWSSPITWAFLGGCGFDYFSEKCQAHRNGSRARGWNEDVARTNLRQRLDDRDRPEAAEAFFAEFPRAPLWNRDEWIGFLHHETRDLEAFLGSDWWEWAASIGNVPDVNMLAHWKMLRLATAQLPAAHHEQQQVGPSDALCGESK